MPGCLPKGNHKIVVAQDEVTGKTTSLPPKQWNLQRN
jgi:hypothetical protein